MAKITLIVSAGIAAYKAPELIRCLGKQAIDTNVVITKSAQEFVTPLVLSSLSNNKVYSELFNLNDEHEMGHIQLARARDCIVVAPCSANLMAKMAHGLADDLASTLLLAATCPVIIAPAMNMHMWQHDATQANLAIVQKRGVRVIPPEVGDMACGDYGPGRMAEPETITQFVASFIQKSDGPLSGLHAIVTAGPTVEPIDPVRFISNRSSGKQGYAIAKALRDLSCKVTLIAGPTALPNPENIATINVETADDMLGAVHNAMPCDIAICTAAVADWRMRSVASHKVKKSSTTQPPQWDMEQTPDILASIAQAENRPKLLIGFAAETQNLATQAHAKRRAKGCNWLMANLISDDAPVFGADDNQILFIDDKDKSHDWPRMSKQAIAQQLASKIATYFDGNLKPHV